VYIFIMTKALSMARAPGAAVRTPLALACSIALLVFAADLAFGLARDKAALALLIAVVALGTFACSYWILRHAPASDLAKPLPDRVRKAFDTLSEGVLVLDADGRIVQANESFRSLHGASELGFAGKRASDIPWLAAALSPRRSDEHPWTFAMREGLAVTGELLEIPQPVGAARKAKLAASPITDSRAVVRGCLVSFTDVTELDRKNAELAGALAALEESRQKIALQNSELQSLANIDPLTGCLNRRAFFEAGEALLRKNRAEGTLTCCAMADIDRFKLFNDTYGHAVGDQVIQQVARVLKAALRPTDLLCRYGGEEFCILLPGIDAARAAVIVERVWLRVEAQVGRGVRSIPDLRVTASFGLSGLEFDAADLKVLIDQADQALYAAKNSGRNCVVRYDEIAAVPS
jgi:diguanylate cyclase (GGDEF)-like protein/PAS domain S-box-containing protein